MIRFVAVALLVSCAANGRGTGPGGGPGGTSNADSPPTVQLATSREFTNGAVTLTITAGNADRVELLQNDTVLSEAAMFDWDTTALAEGSYSVRARAIGAGGTADSDPITIVVDRTAPKVVKTCPLAGHAAGVMAAFAKFDEPVSSGRLQLLRSDGTIAASIVAIAGDTLTLERAEVWGPAEVRLVIEEVADRAGNIAPSQTISASVPLLGLFGAAETAQGPALALSESTAFVAYLKGGAIQGKSLSLTTEEEVSLGTIHTGGAEPAIVADGADTPVVAFTANGEVKVSRLDGTAWQIVQSIAGTLPRLARTPQGDVMVAVRRGNTIVVEGAPALDLGGPASDYDFAIGADARRFLAVSDSTHKLSVYELGATWNRIGTPEQLQAAPAATVEHPKLVIQGTAPVVAWAETSELQVAGAPLGKRNVFVSRRSTQWERLGHALDLRTKDDAFAPSLAVGADGRLFVSFVEEGEQQLAVFGHDWRFLAGGYRPATALALDSSGLAVLVGADTRLQRVNVNPSAPPAGMTNRVTNTNCTVPENLSDGASISATACYADVAKHEPVAAAIPYDLISPLWTDGAEKRRFFVLPGDAKLGYKELDAWEVPPGTVLIKEFYWNQKPMETRMLIRRDETRWTGYSFRWNTAGTDATLMGPSGGRGSFDGHAHVFPGRAECLQCHNDIVGNTIGLLTANLNRSKDYGDVTDNQLRTLHALGVLDTEPEADPPRLAASEDTSESYERRSRSYIQANCAHCHHTYQTGNGIPAKWGPWYYPLEKTNLCDHTHVVEGEHEASVIWRRDQNFQNAGRMPPIGTLMTDPTNDIIIRNWIDGMQPGECPPWDGTTTGGHDGH